MQTILGAVASCIVLVVTTYFGVRGDVRDRAAVKELIEIYERLPAGESQSDLQREIKRRIKAMSPTSDQIADGTKSAQRRSIGSLLAGGIILYAGSLWATGLEETVSSWAVVLVFLALPLGSLMICAGAISWLRYWRKYH